MLQINKRSKGSGDSSNRPDTVLFETLRNITGIMNRQRPIAVVMFIFCFALGALLSYYSGKFHGRGSIVIDKRKLQLFQKESILGEPDIDAATVQTEVEVLKSDNIGVTVVRKLHLADDPEFNGSSKGPVDHFMALLGSLTGFSVSERGQRKVNVKMRPPRSG